MKIIRKSKTILDWLTFLILLGCTWEKVEGSVVHWTEDVSMEKPTKSIEQFRGTTEHYLSTSFSSMPTCPTFVFYSVQPSRQCTRQSFSLKINVKGFQVNAILRDFPALFCSVCLGSQSFKKGNQWLLITYHWSTTSRQCQLVHHLFFTLSHLVKPTVLPPLFLLEVKRQRCTSECSLIRFPCCVMDHNQLRRVINDYYQSST